MKRIFKLWLLLVTVVGLGVVVVAPPGRRRSAAVR